MTENVENTEQVRTVLDLHPIEIGGLDFGECNGQSVEITESTGFCDINCLFERAKLKEAISHYPTAIWGVGKNE